MGRPAFIILIIPLILLYSYMQQFYLRAKRELKRLDGISRGPIFAHFQETLGGITTICAYNQQERFILENRRRIDANMKAFIPSITANRWLGVRLEFIGSIIIFATAAFALAGVLRGQHVSAGTVGLAMTYALYVLFCATDS
jgi:ATP-binding cassette, subfamily C (CFTR/MRP), member 1